MGKFEQTQLPIQNQHDQNHDHGSSWYVGCSNGFSRLFSFKCVFVLILGVCVLLTAVFSIFKLHHWQSGFDAKASIKNSGK